MDTCLAAGALSRCKASWSPSFSGDSAVGQGLFSLFPSLLPLLPLLSSLASWAGQSGQCWLYAAGGGGGLQARVGRRMRRAVGQLEWQ